MAVKKNNKSEETFFQLITKIKQNHLFKENEYHIAKNLLKNMIARNKNYTLVSDMKSTLNMEALIKTVKAINTFDENIHSMKIEELKEVIEHIKTIELLSDRILELSKKDNITTHGKI